MMIQKGAALSGTLLNYRQNFVLDSLLQRKAVLRQNSVESTQMSFAAAPFLILTSFDAAVEDLRRNITAILQNIMK